MYFPLFEHLVVVSGNGVFGTEHGRLGRYDARLRILVGVGVFGD
jgi:hypothetical protein